LDCSAAGKGHMVVACGGKRYRLMLAQATAVAIYPQQLRIRSSSTYGCALSRTNTAETLSNVVCGRQRRGFTTLYMAVDIPWEVSTEGCVNYHGMWSVAVKYMYSGRKETTRFTPWYPAT
jgi:hypothetical protein